MSKKYENKFIRLKKGFWFNTEPDYQKVIKDQTSQGWRLIQIFSPYRTKFYELIFEREINN